MTREEFTTHVAACQKSLRLFLTALCCGDSALADDLAQDTFIKAFLAADSFREDAKFSSWIHRIAYNTYISHLRTIRNTTLPIDSAAPLHASDKADSSFTNQSLEIALTQLSDTERTAILLHYMQGYAIKEIAQIIGASPDAVKQQLSRGRAHLRTRLNLIDSK